MYTDPHEFAIDIPTLMSNARVASYRRYARPRALARLFSGGTALIAATTAVALALFFVLHAAIAGTSNLGQERSGPGSFYEVVSYAAMVVPSLLLGACASLFVGASFLVFWREIGGSARELFNPSLWWRALGQAINLRWMRGGGGECYFPEEEAPSPVRRRLHGLVMWGFLVTFAATVSAAIAENLLEDPAPYPLLSVPVGLGLVGGAMVSVGCIGMLRARSISPARERVPDEHGMSGAFIVSLLSVALTGELLLIARSTPAMGALLLIHLATVAAFFITAPYGKLVHPAYRIGAIMRHQSESRG